MGHPARCGARGWGREDVGRRRESSGWGLWVRWPPTHAPSARARMGHPAFVGAVFVLEDAGVEVAGDADVEGAGEAAHDVGVSGWHGVDASRVLGLARSG
jgi:hypothetical protein